MALSFVRVPITIISFGLFAATSVVANPTAVHACACCDGFERRDIVGWSERGSALVRYRWYTCADKRALEVWRPGETKPNRCFDLFAENPNAVSGCGFDDLVDGWSEWPPAEAERHVRTSARTRFFPHTPRVLAADRLQVRMQSVPRRRDEDEWHRPVRVSVGLRTDGEVAPLTTFRVYLGHPERGLDGSWSRAAGEGRPTVSGPIGIRLWPSPDGRYALLRVRGHDTSPGTGHFPDELHWVKLPDELRSSAFVAASPVVYALPELGQEPVEVPARLARRAARAGRQENRRGLRLHRAGDYEAAARAFATAILHRRPAIWPRYNLACAYALLGAPEQALSILASLATAADSGCSRCRDALERAREDVDLRTLRSNDRFRRTVGLD